MQRMGSISSPGRAEMTASPPGLGLNNDGASRDQASGVRSIEILRLKRPGRATLGSRGRGRGDTAAQVLSSFSFTRKEGEGVGGGIGLQ